jgi:hypothetical protein
MKVGYKATYNYMCRGFKYEIGKTYEIEGKSELCERGFHYCELPHQTLAFYPINPYFKLLEIQDLGNTKIDKQKCSTNKIKILREIENVGTLSTALHGMHDAIYKNDKNYIVSSGLFSKFKDIEEFSYTDMSMTFEKKIKLDSNYRIIEEESDNYKYRFFHTKNKTYKFYYDNFPSKCISYIDYFFIKMFNKESVYVNNGSIIECEK